MITGRDLSLIRLEGETAPARDDTAVSGGVHDPSPEPVAAGADEATAAPARL
jgi:hypothetical protein